MKKRKQGEVGKKYVKNKRKNAFTNATGWIF